MADKLIRIELNCETGEEIIIPLTDEEIAEAKIAEAQAKAYKAQQEAEAQAKAEAKVSALAKLEALGLTEEEAAALIS